MGQSIIDELVTLLGFKVDPGAHPTAAKFTRALDSINKYAMVASASIIGAATSLVYFAEKSAHAGAEIERFRQLTGMSTDSIQRWSYAANQIAGSKESILRDIEGITSSLNPIMPGDFNQGMYLFFGSRLKDFKDANQVLQELAKVFPKLTPQKAMQWGRLMGISPDTVMVLRHEKDGLAKLFAEADAQKLTASDAEKAYRFEQAWKRALGHAQKFAQQLGIRILPFVEKVITKTIQWYEANQRLINGGLQRFIEGVGRGVSQFSGMLDNLKAAIPWVAKFVGLIADPKLLGGGVALALAGVAAVLTIIAAKYIAIGTAVMAIIAALEDASTSFEVDEQGKIGSSGKDTLINRGLDWIHDKLPSWMRTPENEWKRAGSASGKSRAKDMLDNFAQWYRNDQLGVAQIQKNIADAIPNQGAGNTVTQTNTIQIQSTDPYGAGRETVYQLERMANPALAGGWR